MGGGGTLGMGGTKTGKAPLYIYGDFVFQSGSNMCIKGMA